MFIIHGRYPKKELIGKVGDYCPTCKNLREFEIVDHFEGTHIYCARRGSPTPPMCPPAGLQSPERSFGYERLETSDGGVGDPRRAQGGGFMEQLKRSETPYRVNIPEDLIPKLRALHAGQKDLLPCLRKLIQAEDVLQLSHSLGPDWFLTFDGRFLVDKFDWDGTGAYEVSDPRQAWIWVVYAADHFGFPDLLRVLPARPADAVDCSKCGGSGWLFPPPGDGRWGVVCELHCGGLGWQPGTTPESQNV